MIKVDITMPENCHECMFNNGEYSPDYYEKRYCVMNGHKMRLMDYKKKPIDCPLIDVSEDKLTQ